MYILLWGRGSKDNAFLYHGLCVSLISNNSLFCSNVCGGGDAVCSSSIALHSVYRM
jgi:hypothetical protein